MEEAWHGGSARNWCVVSACPWLEQKRQTQQKGMRRGNQFHIVSVGWFGISCWPGEGHHHHRRRIQRRHQLYPQVAVRTNPIFCQVSHCVKPFSWHESDWRLTSWLSWLADEGMDNKLSCYSERAGEWISSFWMSEPEMITFSQRKIGKLLTRRSLYALCCDRINFINNWH